MSIDTNALKAQSNIVAVVGSYVALKKRGSEFIGLCPFHADTNPSFTVIPAKQFCHCFACGASHDVIGFVQEIEGIDFQAACERLGAKNDWAPRAPITHEARHARQERITSVPPPTVAAPDMTLRELGVPTRTFALLGLAGETLGFEARYAGEGGKKEIRMWTWGARGDAAPAWGCGHFNTPRPLYGLQRLALYPEATVAIFEGPKKADAGSKLLNSYACISWTGGANAWHKHNMEPLRGRKVLIWPDADEPGWQSCDKLAAQLASKNRGGLGCAVRIIDTHGMPEGWDIADAEEEGWDTAKVIEWAKPRAADYVPEQPNPAPDGAAGAEELPPVEAYVADHGAKAADPSAKPPKRRRTQLGVVDGNTVRVVATDAEPLPASMSEDALAEAFVADHGRDWRFVKPWGAWFEWDGDGWVRDDSGKVDRLAVQITRQALYWDEGKALSAKEKRMVNKRSTAGALRDLAGTDRRVAASVDQWDADAWMLGVPGGVMDLRCGKLLEPEREQYITKRAAVAPDNGKPVLWLEYLDRCHVGDAEVIAYLQRFAGYCCTGETGEHALAFLYGTGRNGKGVFLETISRILGDYAKTASINTFLEQRNPAHSTELARLHKARLVITEEAGTGGKWNESRIKHMTGGGKITARYMRQDDFEFTPNFKLLIAANHKPSMRSVDVAMKSRIHLVPFAVTIPVEERDPGLLDKLQAEWPQILGWMLDGCRSWQERGLTPPQRILDATTEYMESEDVLGDWIAERCVRSGESDGADAFHNYAKWCEEQGHSAWSRMGWSKAVLERDGVASRRSNGRTVLVGLSLKPTHS